MKQIYSAPLVPQAGVCINKSRMKVYNKETEPTYYLSDGQEFSIELYNPTSDTILAKIELNSKMISQGGLVLKPGQRVFLERYFDVARKFKFETYEVSNTSETRRAIESNGDLRIQFFREIQPIYNPPVYIPPVIFRPLPYYSNPFTLTSSGTFSTATNSGTLRGTLGGSNSNTTNINAQNISTQGLANDGLASAAGASAYFNSTDYSQTFTSNASLSMSTDNLAKEKPRSRAKLASKSRPSASPKTIETGRVEAGSSSNQQFEYVSKEFEYFAFHTINIKLLPLSQKTTSVEELQIKRYCPNCGAKQKAEWKYCPSCSAKL